MKRRTVLGLGGGAVATPLWDMHVATWLRTRDLPGGRYEVKSAGANFYTMPGETKLLERFANPYTGKSVDVPYGQPRASVTVYDRMLHVEPEDPSRPTFTANDWSTYIGKLTDVVDPHVKNPPSAQDFNDILDFPAWLQMPAQWRTLFEGRFPQEAKDPGGLLA